MPTSIAWKSGGLDSNNSLHLLFRPFLAGRFSLPVVRALGEVALKMSLSKDSVEISLLYSKNINSVSNAWGNRLDYIYHNEKLTKPERHFLSQHFFVKHSSRFGCGHIPTYSCIPYTFNILLMEETLHHLGCTKPCKQLDKLPTSTGDHRISPISNSIRWKWYGNSTGGPWNSHWRCLARFQSSPGVPSPLSIFFTQNLDQISNS